MQKESPFIRLYSLDQGYAWLALFHLLIHISPAVTGQPVASTDEPDKNKTVVDNMVIFSVLFLILASFSLYSCKCSNRQDETHAMIDTGATGNPSQAEPKGLNQATIETFPTFIYSDVKGLKIGKETLACAVCLNEFHDEETLRMIPKCCHVYHPDCIDVWLASHTTCPVCRADLVPQPEDTNMNVPPMLNVQIPVEQQEREHEHESESGHEHESGFGEERRRQNEVESPEVNLLRRIRTLHQSRLSRSKSTGFLFSRWKLLRPLVQPAENYERFTLSLPRDVQSQMLNSTLKRANSHV